MMTSSGVRCLMIAALLACFSLVFLSASPWSKAEAKNPKSISSCNKDYQKWKRLEGYGAFAVGPNWCTWTFNYGSLAEARQAALSSCKKKSRGCTVVAVNSSPSLVDVNWKKCMKDLGDTAVQACVWLLNSKKLNKRDRAAVLVQRGNVHFNRSEEVLALEYYNDAIATDGTNPWAYSNRAIIRENNGDLEQALEDARTGLRLFKPDKNCGTGCDLRADAQGRVDRIKSRLATINAYSDESLCQMALDHTKKQWDSRPHYKSYLVVAGRRDLDVGDCRAALGYDRSPNKFESMLNTQVCVAALNEKQVIWADRGEEIARELRRRKLLSVGDCRVILGLRRDPVPPHAVASANELLDRVSEFAREIKISKNTLDLSKLAQSLKSALAEQDEFKVMQITIQLNGFVLTLPGYQEFLSTRAERQAAKLREKLAKDRASLTKLASFSMTQIQADVASDKASKLSIVHSTIESIPPGANQELVSSALRYSLTELVKLGFQKELSEIGFSFAELKVDTQTAPMVTDQRRVALVIGNSTYQRGGKLLNPENDARAMSSTLRQLGFEVLEAFDTDRRAFKAIAATFDSRVRQADAALFFYAGHAVQVKGQNYLLPVDAYIESVDQLDGEALTLDSIVKAMSSEGKLGIVLIDACRDNPYEEVLNSNSEGLSAKSIVGGLAEPTITSSGLLYGFATSFGQKASDGTGEHSPFSSALLKYLPKKGRLIEDVMAEVRYEVIEATQKQQNPWITTGLLTKFYMNP